MDPKKTLQELARPLYPEHGQNSWDHVNQVTVNMTNIVKSLENRDLTLPEYAAGLFHDCSVLPRGDKKDHGYWSSEISAPLLLATGLFTKEQLADIKQAIIEHETNDKKSDVYSSPIGDLLASGDVNPPNVPWILNKSWCWGIKNGLTPEERLDNMYKRMPEYYGSKSTTVYPKYYRRFYADSIKDMQQQFDTITKERMLQIVQAYRKKHGIKGDTILMPDPTE